MSYYQDTEHITTDTKTDEHTSPVAEQHIAQKEKSLFEDPIFYAALIVVGIAGFFATRKAQNNIRRSRLRASRRFQGSNFTPRNGQYEWEEEEVGIGS